MARELIIPPGATAPSESVEVLRAWRVGDGLHCSIAPHAWDDVDAWGLVLADVARHVANALRDANGADVEDSLDRIRYMFNVELLNPKDTPQGKFM